MNPEDYVVSDDNLKRPTKTSTLVGDISKARKVFGFNPKVKFKELVKLMVEADLEKECLNANKSS